MGGVEVADGVDVIDYAEYLVADGIEADGELEAGVEDGALLVKSKGPLLARGECGKIEVCGGTGREWGFAA